MDRGLTEEFESEKSEDAQEQGPDRQPAEPAIDEFFHLIPEDADQDALADKARSTAQKTGANKDHQRHPRCSSGNRENLVGDGRQGGCQNCQKTDFQKVLSDLVVSFPGVEKVDDGDADGIEGPHSNDITEKSTGDGSNGGHQCEGDRSLGISQSECDQQGIGRDGKKTRLRK